ncbi:MAG TPA: MFS transporter [Saprospiraceae bacterium]|nr:MFS transporter [Saprospiraceae bacterium]
MVYLVLINAITLTTELNDKKTITGWAYFDWANSAYYLVISTAIFPIYFSNVAYERIDIFGGSISSSALYSFSVTLSYILIALLSPLLSGIADYSGRRMYFLKLFTLTGAIGCIGLFLFKSPETMWIGTAAFILGTIGAAGGLVFYDSYLPLIATEDQYDRVSAKGYAYGYLGSVLLLIFCLVMIQKPEWFFISDPKLPSRISFVLVGLWWLGFAQITFRRLPPDDRIRNIENLFKKGWHELILVWHKIKEDTHIKRFLASYFFYIAGVHTVIYLASIFASQELGFQDTELIITILLLQLIAIPGALLFAKISTIKGNKFSLLIQIIIWILICAGAYATTEKWQFFTIAGFVGLVLGGIQSLSRATYAKLLEGRKDDPTSFFSFYDIISKLAIISGTFMFGLVNSITGNMRMSVLVLILFFIGGLVMLITVDKSRINTVTSNE